jgi:hypothetical protein
MNRKTNPFNTPIIIASTVVCVLLAIEPKTGSLSIYKSHTIFSLAEDPGLDTARNRNKGLKD